MHLTAQGFGNSLAWAAGSEPVSDAPKSKVEEEQEELLSASPSLKKRFSS